MIQWYEWSRETFTEAVERDRPVILVLEKPWCGLSRLLHTVAWNNPEISQRVNTHFIPVRVDADRRPDIARRYSMGGWPVIAFLTPDADPITGSTFMPPDVLVNALDNVIKLYRHNRAEVMDKVSSMVQAVESARMRRSDPSRKPSPWMTSRIIEILKETSDSDLGGFGTKEKFPQFDALEFLLSVYRRTGDDDLLKMAQESVDAMTQNGLYDWDEGGFYRMSDEPDWSSPRREKLLVDQARHIKINLWLYQITEEQDYYETAEGVIDYCRNTLYDPASKTFAGSQLYMPDYLMGDTSVSAGQDDLIIDNTIFLDANCQMVSALLYAGGVLEDSSLADMGLGCLKRLMELLVPQGEFAFHYHDSIPQVQGLLQDQVEYGLALLDAYQLTADVAYIEQAEEKAELIEKHLCDSHPGYFDAENPCDLSKLSLRDKSFDDNMRTVAFFSRLSRLTNTPDWLEKAEKVLFAFTAVWEQLGTAAAGYGLGLLDVFAEPVLVNIDRDMDGLQDLLQTVSSIKEPIVLVIPKRLEQSTHPIEITFSDRILSLHSDEDINSAISDLIENLPGSIDVPVNE